MDEVIFQSCEGFEWDEGNIEKNWRKHSVHWQECEQFFFNDPLLLQDDTKHSTKEKRYFALGQSDARRYLMVVFTIRQNLIRVISARPQSGKEKKVYEQAQKNTKI